jgi:hypothetical protein
MAPWLYATNFYVAHPIMAVYTCICCAWRFVAMLSLGKKMAPNSALTGYVMVGVAMDNYFGARNIRIQLYAMVLNPSSLVQFFFYMFSIFGPIGTIETIHNCQASL